MTHTVVFLGFELIIVGALLAAGVVARTLFRAPWVIEASSRDSLTPGDTSKRGASRSMGSCRNDFGRVAQGAILL